MDATVEKKCPFCDAALPGGSEAACCGLLWDSRYDEENSEVDYPRWYERMKARAQPE